MIEIDDERSRHHAAVDALHREVFGGACEADLVTRLRCDGHVVLSLVALDADQIVGHILFSRLEVELDSRAIPTVSLAPMAVRADRQHTGVGTRLIRNGLRRLRQDGWATVFVLGHPDYYPRFGFSADLASKFTAPFNGAAFMALELVPGALGGGTGSVCYPAAFDVG